MAFCDLSHTFHKQFTNISQHVFVILLWGILMSSLKGAITSVVAIMGHNCVQWNRMEMCSIGLVGATCKAIPCRIC